MATFITSRLVDESITISVETSTGYWKYYHDGSYSSAFDNPDSKIVGRTISVSNLNGEFTIVSCLADGTESGNVTQLYLQNNGLTSFVGTDLTSLTYLDLNSNGLTSFDGTGLTSLTQLYLHNNGLTSFDGTGLTSLTQLYLVNNQLTQLYLGILTKELNNSVLEQLVQNSVYGGYLSSSGGEYTSSQNYNYLINDLGWSLVGLYFVSSSSGKLRIKGVTTPR